MLFSAVPLVCDFGFYSVWGCGIITVMKNAVISELFSQMADIMEILGEDPFRINSYRKVARVIGDTPTDVEVLDAGGKLAEMPGIGKSSLAKIEEFLKTGKMTAYEELLKKIPTDTFGFAQGSRYRAEGCQGDVGKSED